LRSVWSCKGHNGSINARKGGEGERERKFTGLDESLSEVVGLKRFDQPLKERK